MKYPEDFIDTVICGDSIKIMKSIPSGEVSLVLTDPPYNAKNIGPRNRKYSSGTMQLPEAQYKKFCRDWFKGAKKISRTIVFTPGIANICNYPQPRWVICWHKPSSCSYSRIAGFNAWEPIFIYGELPFGKRIGQDYIKRNTLNFKKGIEKDHPCPKPLSLWSWLVEHFSLEGGLILDPFMGSGTTAMACVNLNRRFIGIETVPEYCRMSRERAETARRQGRMFTSKAPAEITKEDYREDEEE